MGEREGTLHVVIDTYGTEVQLRACAARRRSVLPVRNPASGGCRGSFESIGQAAGGVALFLTGHILSAQRIELGPNVLSGTVLKNVVHPLFAVGLILALPMDRDTARAAVLLCVLPSGFFGVVFRLRYELETNVAGSTLIVSSLASVVTLPLALVLTAGS
jgi:malonate transporter